MLDILMWPWVERRRALVLIYKEPTNFSNENFPHSVSTKFSCKLFCISRYVLSANINLFQVKWVQAMKAQPFVQENVCSHEKFAQLIIDLKAGNVDYDKL